ncbi:MAG TPA: hypothetical protein VF377_10470 [Acidimicrobiia bacterium]
MAYTDPSTLTFTAGSVLTAAELNTATNDQFLAVFPDGGSAVDWDPDLEADTTDATVTVDGAKYRVGAMQFAWARFSLTAPGSGIYFVTLPSTAAGITDSTSNGAGQVVGKFVARRDSPAQIVTGGVVLATSTTVRFNADTTSGQSSRLESNVPWAWAAGDVLSFYVAYPIA